jgi:hypothetical protein
MIAFISDVKKFTVYKELFEVAFGNYVYHKVAYFPPKDKYMPYDVRELRVFIHRNDILWQNVYQYKYDCFFENCK